MERMESSCCDAGVNAAAGLLGSLAFSARHGFPLGPFQQRQAEHWQRLLGAFQDAATR